jgi:hypothetical protein
LVLELSPQNTPVRKALISRKQGVHRSLEILIPTVKIRLSCILVEALAALEFEWEGMGVTFRTHGVKILGDDT